MSCKNCQNIQEELDLLYDEFKQFKGNLKSTAKSFEEESDQKTEELEKENMKLENQIRILREELKEKTQTLSKEIRILESKLKNSEEEKDNFTEKVKNLNRKIAQIEIENDELKNCQREKEEVSKEFFAKADFLQEKLAIVEVEFEEFKIKNEAEKGRLLQTLLEAEDEILVFKNSENFKEKLENKKSGVNLREINEFQVLKIKSQNKQWKEKPNYKNAIKLKSVQTRENFLKCSNLFKNGIANLKLRSASNDKNHFFKSTNLERMGSNTGRVFVKTSFGKSAKKCVQNLMKSERFESSLKPKSLDHFVKISCFRTSAANSERSSMEQKKLRENLAKSKFGISNEGINN